MSDPILQRMLRFIDESPTPHHCVATAARWLSDHGFTEIEPGSPPAPLSPGACHFVVRGGSIVAFRMGSAPPSEAGFHMVAAHTDSPNLRIKPQPYIVSEGYVRLGVEPYGGVLLATWADRDLGIAGPVVVRDGQGTRTHLVELRRPLCRVPNLAIHLNRGVNNDGLKLNKQSHLPALISLENDDDALPLHRLLAGEIGCDPGDILTWDLSLFDLTPCVVSGANGEFVHAPRLDNQGSSHAAVEALLAAVKHDPGDSTALIALFDHEEVGSRTYRGADGRLLQGILERIVRDAELTAPGGLGRALDHSMMISADMTHAVHPAYVDKSEAQHMPRLNRGPAIKQNVNQRYGTDSESAAMFLGLCEAAGVPSQWFVNRSDLACGSTVGPMLAAGLGVPTVDVGNPMLSMHSIREMCGSLDQKWMVAAMELWLRG